jgi:hypothetical protein
MKKYDANVLLNKTSMFQKQSEYYSASIKKHAYFAALPAVLAVIGDVGMAMFVGQTVSLGIEASRDAYNDSLKDNADILINILNDLVADYSDNELVKPNLENLKSTITALTSLKLAYEKYDAISGSDKSNPDTIKNMLPILLDIQNNIKIFNSNYFIISSLMHQLSKGWSSYGIGHKLYKFVHFLGFTAGFRSDVEKINHSLPEMRNITEQLESQIKAISNTLSSKAEEHLKEKESSKPSVSMVTSPSTKALVELNQQELDRLSNLSRLKKIQ